MQISFIKEYHRWVGIKFRPKNVAKTVGMKNNSTGFRSFLGLKIPQKRWVLNPPPRGAIFLEGKLFFLKGKFFLTVRNFSRTTVDFPRNGLRFILTVVKVNKYRNMLRYLKCVFASKFATVDLSNIIMIIKSRITILELNVLSVRLAICMLDIILVFRGWRMVEDRWRFCNNLNFRKYVSIRIIQRNFTHRVEGGGIKQQKILGGTAIFALISKHINIFTSYFYVL